MTLGVLAMLTVAGAAFLMLMEQDYRASANAALKTQAELAARSGLEHAKLLVRYSRKKLDSGEWLVASHQGAIHAAGQLYSNEAEADSGWHRYFKADPDAGGDTAPWIATGTHHAGVSMKGRRIGLKADAVSGAWNGEYNVCVADLDGKLHGDIQRWPSSGSPSELVKAVSKLVWPSEDEKADRLADRSTAPYPPFMCLSGPARRAEVAAKDEKYGLERFFTVYPPASSDPPPLPEESRPLVNVNTAWVELVAELLKPIPSFASEQDKASALASHLEVEHPFPDRADFEEAVRAVTGFDAWRDLPDPAAGQHLTETQFNDVLNSTNPSQQFPRDKSFYDSNDDGIYEYDAWPPYSGDGTGPSQAGGEYSFLPPGNVTWSTELKFDSRFFHIYVLGRACTSAGEVTNIKARLHAVFDAERNRVVWLRWLCSSEGSVVDLGP